MKSFLILPSSLLLCLFLSSIRRVQDSRVDPPSRNEISQRSRSPKSSNGSLALLRVRAPIRVTKKPAKIPQIAHNPKYELPVIHQRNDTGSKRQCNCACHKDDHYYDVLREILRSRQEAKKITFDYAVENADRWTLRVALSRIEELRYKLQDAKDKYGQEFDSINKSVGDVAEDVERTYDKVSRKLDELNGIPLMSKEYQGHEEFERQYRMNYDHRNDRAHNELLRRYKMKQTL